jgi:cytochrome c peroxidase
LLFAVLLAACGGGGSNDRANGGPIAGPPNPPPPPPPNNSPILQNPNAAQRAVHLHAFSYDPTQGGSTFRDPDGDPLTYTIVLGHTHNPHNDPNPPPGLRVEGNRVVGAPEELGVVIVTITANDGRSGSTQDQFMIRVEPNGMPAVVSANADVLVGVGGFVDVEGTQAGTTFSDPDGDALAYEVTLRGEPRGLTVSGTRTSGVFNSIGLVEVTIVARDIYGGVGSDVFLIAAPAPEPGSPSLPDPPYVYRDEDLPLPHNHQANSSTSQPSDNRITNEGATLGRVLFYDRRLSITNTVACATCHVQSRGFGPQDRFSIGALGIPTRRHAMALTNVRFGSSHHWFADMRAETLETLVLEPMQNPEELGSARELLESKLRATSFYPALFEAAFGTAEITHDRVARALAQFLRSLLSYRAKADLAFNPMTNDPWQPELFLTPQEFRGLEIFRNDTGARCSACHDLHFGANIWHANNGLDVVPTDPGALNPAIQRNGSLGVFRAASLRNVAISAPYMHDGRFATLRDVINHYDHGVQDSPHLDFILRDSLGSGLPRRLNLSEEDKDDLEAFLHTMTDHELLADPKFSDPFD